MSVPKLPDAHAKDVANLSLLYRLQRDREDAVNEERSLTLRMKARARRVASLACPDHKPKCPRCVALANQWVAGKGDPAMVLALAEMNAPLTVARQPVTAWRKATEKEMEHIARSLPLASFVEATRGFGYLGLAQIMAEAGPLSDYANPAKLWKRFGLAVFDGKAQRRTTDKELAAAMGFAPRRRAVMWNIGDSLIKQGVEYRAVYLARKAYEEDQHPELRPIQRHRRAQRYMEKRLLRDLWRAWR